MFISVDPILNPGSIAAQAVSHILQFLIKRTGLDESLGDVFTGCFDPAADGDFAFFCQKGNFPDFTEVELNGIEIELSL